MTVSEVISLESYIIYPHTYTLLSALPGALRWCWSVTNWDWEKTWLTNWQRNKSLNQSFDNYCFDLKMSFLGVREFKKNVRIFFANYLRKTRVFPIAWNVLYLWVKTYFNVFYFRFKHPVDGKIWEIQTIWKFLIYCESSIMQFYSVVQVYFSLLIWVTNAIVRSPGTVADIWMMADRDLKIRTPLKYDKQPNLFASSVL